MKRPDLAALALVALCVAGAVVLVALGVPVPDFLTFAGTTALGIAGGAYLPQPGTQPGTSTSVPATAPAVLPPVLPPVPAPVFDPAATGVMRIATHAP